MKSKTLGVLNGLVIFAALNMRPLVASAQGNAFSYQGRLNDGSNPASGLYDLRFNLYDSSAGAGTVGLPITNAATLITDGLFTVLLDFGPGIFNGPGRWLEIGVRTNGSTSFTMLAPRHPLAAVPYAQYAMTPAGPPGPQGDTGFVGPQGPSR